MSFPSSHILFKGGEITDVTTEIVRNILLEKPETPSGYTAEDLYGRIREIYTG